VQKYHSKNCKCPFCRKKEGINNPFYGKKHSLETKEKMKEIWNKRKNSKEFQEKRKNQGIEHSKIMKNIWNDKNSVYNTIKYRQKLSNRNKSIITKIELSLSSNKSEAKLFYILSKCKNNEFIYVGNNPIIKFTFGGKIPDFIDVNNKKIIELFGDYWHSEKKTGRNKELEEYVRTSYFESLGYNTLIIWEYELKDENKLIQKLEKFIENKKKNIIENLSSKEKDLYYLKYCKNLSSLSSCLSRKIGAILVKNNIILTEGVNESPRGVKHCNERDRYFFKKLNNVTYLIEQDDNILMDMCPRRFLRFPSGQGLHLCQAGHAERNALIQAARNGISTLGTTLYCWCPLPCKDCCIEIINSGITKIVCLEGNDYDNYSRVLLNEANINIVQIKEQNV
jgi:dCMP deaminase